MIKPKSLGYKKRKQVKNKKTWRKKGTGQYYDTKEWRNLRAYKIGLDPVCEVCESKGFTIEAKVVDHIQPINEGGAVFDLDNLQSLCTTCHNRKTGKESRG